MSDFLGALGAAERQAAEAHAAERLAEAGITLLEWRDFIEDAPPEWDWIVPGVIAKGMKGDLNAKSKQCKSFFGMQLAHCVSTGRPFLGMAVPRARRCAYFNLELIGRGAWERGKAMDEAMGGAPARGMLYEANLRGKAGKLRELVGPLVAEVRRIGIDLVVLDPRYKLIAEGEDENCAAGLRGVLDFRDALAEAAAVLMIGHDPKGDTAGKGMADRGAGSYTAGADYDFAFALSPHELDGRSVLSTSCRYRKSPPDITIRFDDERQVFEAEADTPAIVKRARCGGGGASADPKEKAERERLKQAALEKAVRDFIKDNDPIGKDAFRAAIAETPAGAAVAQNTLRAAINILLEKGVIAETPRLERKEGGAAKRMRCGGLLVGAPEKIKAYKAAFGEPTPQPL